MKKNYAQYLLEKTHQDYNLIAENYARTRTFVPKDVRALAEYALPGERILDSGCANGRLVNIWEEKEIDYFGVDISERLIKIAQLAHPEARFQSTNALNLPFSANFFDKVYSISILHNIPSKSFQLQYLKEAERVLKPGGFLILRVWDLWKRKAAVKLIFKYVFLKFVGKSQLDFFDVFIPWKDSRGEVLVQRYFHCFRKREIESLIKKAGLEIKKSWSAGRGSQANLYIIAQKPLS